MLRNQCWDGIGNRSGFSGIEGVDGSEAEKRVHHIGRCLDYLRQGILCNMDTTIEWPVGGADGVGTGLHVDGYNIPHHCKRRVSRTRVIFSGIANELMKHVWFRKPFLPL